MSIDQKNTIAAFFSNNYSFAKGKGNNRMTQNMNGRNVYYREYTLEDHNKELRNSIMLPDTAI